MPRRRTRSSIYPFASLVATIGISFVALLVFLIASYDEKVPGEPEVLPTVGADWQQNFQERVDVVTRQLESGAIALPRPTIELQGGGNVQYSHRRYELTLPREEEERLLAALQAAVVGDPTVSFTVSSEPDAVHAAVGVDGLQTHTVIVHWKLTGPSGPPRVAVIIDDLGDNLLVARELVRLDFPVALAVLPLRPFSREVGELAGHYKREVLLHLPMEPENGAAGAGETVLLRAGAGREEIVQTVNRCLASVPQAIGANNHMGSAFTQDTERMRWVLGHLQKRGLFFVDSRTSPRSVGREVAAELGLPYLERSVFLDDPPGRSVVEERLAELLDLAQRRGIAIAIGHPHRSTLDALRSFAAMARRDKVDIVPLSSLVERRKPPS